MITVDGDEGIGTRGFFVGARGGNCLKACDRVSAGPEVAYLLEQGWNGGLGAGGF